MMRSTRLQLRAPSKKALERRSFALSGCAARRGAVLASSAATCPRSVVVAATPRTKFDPRRAAEVQHLGGAEVAVGADEDFDARPVAADLAH